MSFVMHSAIRQAPTPFDAVVRAWALFLLDKDWRHSPYWRECISRAESALQASLVPTKPDQRSNPETVLTILRNAFQAGSNIAARYPVRYVDIPESSE